MGRLKLVGKFRVATAALVALGYLLGGLLLFLPLPKRSSGNGERYLLSWEDGTQTEEGLFSALSSLAESRRETLGFLREGRRAVLSSGEEFRRAYDLLEGSPLAVLLTADFSVPNALERTALYEKFADVCYFSDGVYRFNGQSVRQSKELSCREVVLLDGALPKNFLMETGAETLTLLEDARFTASAFIGSKISNVVARAPYSARNGGVYLSTPGGVRLLAGLPLETSLSLDGYDFADEGALSACTGLETLTLPYLGSERAPYGSERHPTLLWLFGEEIPSSLKRVKVTGGSVETFAFTACPSLLEIDLCGIEESEVSPSAFSGCVRLEKLHTSAKNLSLQGEFTQTRLPCGCYLYTRKGEIA